MTAIIAGKLGHVQVLIPVILCAVTFLKPLQGLYVRQDLLHARQRYVRQRNGVQARQVCGRFLVDLQTFFILFLAR